VNTGYSRARQRIYLSATLGSMDDLQRRIGGRTITRLTTPTAFPTGTTGERKFVLNASGQEPFDDIVLDWALQQAEAAGGRAAWLCASHAEADELQQILEQDGQSVFRLQPGDNMGDICKLVIITSVPQASSEFERFVVAYLGDASFMRHRVGQRVTQALGRANRTKTDRALYLGLDPRFAQILADPAVRASIPAAAVPTFREALELFDDGCSADSVLSVGIPSIARRYFTDLQLLTSLLRMSWPRATDLMTVADNLEAAIWEDHEFLLRQRRGPCPRRGQQIHLVAPLNSEHCAALLTIASQLLDVQHPRALADQLAYLIGRDVLSADAGNWARDFLERRPDCSAGLSRALSPVLEGVGLHRLDVAANRRITHPAKPLPRARGAARSE